MVERKNHKAAAAAAQADKDKQFKAFQQEPGLLLDEDGEELAPSTPQKAAARHPVVQSTQQCDWGGTGETCRPGGSGPVILGPNPYAPPSLAIIGLPLIRAGGAGHEKYQAICISFLVWLSIH
jgi:hypothetical protein